MKNQLPTASFRLSLGCKSTPKKKGAKIRKNPQKSTKHAGFVMQKTAKILLR
jgi:hypothetical protein